MKVVLLRKGEGNGSLEGISVLKFLVVEMVALDLCEPGIEVFDQVFEDCFRWLLLLSNVVTSASPRVIAKVTLRC